MRLNCMIFLLLILGFFNLNSAQIQTYEDLRSQLKELKPNSSLVADVEGLYLEKEGGYVSVETGKIYFFERLNDKTCVAVLVGDGTFGFMPPTLVEKLQLERFYKTQFFEKKFTSLVFYFTDDTYDYLAKYFNIQSADIDKKVKEIYKSSLEFIITGENSDVEENIAKAFLEQTKTGLFYMQVNTGNYKAYDQAFFWMVNPLADEEVQFSKGNFYAGHGKYIELINEFHCTEHLQNDSLKNCFKDEIKVNKYTIDCKIDDDLKMRCSTKLDFIVQKDSIRWLNFGLSEKLMIDSIVDDEGNNLYFRKGKESYSVWIRSNVFLKDSSNYSLNLYYHGKFLDGNYWIVLHSSTGWYPRFGYREKAYFDIKFSSPEKFKLCSVGEKKSEEKSDGYLITRWISKKPIRNASFNIGDFYEKIVKEDSLSPELDFFYKSDDQVDAVLSDIKLSIAFFNKIYGERITDRFYVTEIPGGYGEAFPGMLHLSRSTFRSSEKKSGSNENFCSHEVSHQWWGIGVDFKSYRDQWLSEGFASYSGLLYTQMSLKNSKAFFDILKEDANDLKTLRKTWLIDGVQGGPISLGYRNNSEATGGDYSVIVYKKGEWVLHMLRNFLIDFKTMDETVFMTILKDFYQTYKDSSASTQDFVDIVNKHVGRDMSWFFTQWVDYNVIPTYTFGYKTEKTLDGKYKVTGRIKQSGVPEGFQMAIPVKIDFGDKGNTIMRINAVSAYQEFEFPLLPLEPKEIQLNVYNSVLCDVEKEDFEDIKPD